MLAVQKPPNMGSSQPSSDPYLPFGCKSSQRQRAFGFQFHSLDFTSPDIASFVSHAPPLQYSSPAPPTPPPVPSYHAGYPLSHSLKRTDSADPNTEPPSFGDAPEPAPGAPLLTDDDSQFLSSFFSDISSNHYNMPSFGEGLNFSNSWLDLPPTFMGSSTLLGQQAPIPRRSSGTLEDHHEQMDVTRMMQSQLMPPPPHPLAGARNNRQQQQQPQQQQQQQQSRLQSLPQQQQSQPQPQPQPHLQPQHAAQHLPQQQPLTLKSDRHHSEEVLNAAATLIQNGAGPRPQVDSDPSQPRRPMGPPVGHLRHQLMEEFKQEQRRDTDTEGLDNTIKDWMFSPTERHSLQGPSLERHVSQNPPRPGLRWGSDGNFQSAQAYKAGPNAETVESQHAEQMKFLDVFYVNQSTGNTRQNSPLPSPGTAPAIPATGPLASKRPDVVEDEEAPPRKRRKSRVVKPEVDSQDEREEEETTGSKVPARKKKNAKNDGRTSSPSVEAGAKRRKSIIGSNAKTPRENLTEEQKRENHIKSEQKRRTLIKVGFDDLCELVPGLRGGGFSKSTMLSMAGEWLEELLEGNKLLTAQLTSLS